MALRQVINFDFWTTMPGPLFSAVNASISAGILTIGQNENVTVALDSQSTWIFNFPWSTASLSNNIVVLRLVDNMTAQMYLQLKTTGKFAFFRGDGTQIGSDSVRTFPADTGNFLDIEVKIVIDNAAGSVELRVNGNVEISATSQDTQNSSNALADRFQWECPNAGGVTPKLKHIIIMDGTGSVMNNFIGPVKVNLHKPNGAGNYSQFTPSAGSNFQNVDEVPPNDDTDYNASGTLNQIDTYTMENLPAGVTSIKAVAVWWRARRDDATTRGLSPIWRISATDYVGANQNVGSAYQYFTQNYATSPATAAAWGTSELDAAEAGVKVTT